MIRMITLLVLLCSGCVTRSASPEKQADIEAGAAYVIEVHQTSNRPKPKPKVPRAECRECKGTGRVRSGDGLSWVDCGNCYEEPQAKAPKAVNRTTQKTTNRTTRPATNEPALETGRRRFRPLRMIFRRR